MSQNLNSTIIWHILGKDICCKVSIIIATVTCIEDTMSVNRSVRPENVEFTVKVYKKRCANTVADIP